MMLKHRARMVSAPLEWAIGRVTPVDRLVRLVNRKLAPQAVNFGGGPAFSAIGWLNLDEAGGCGAAFHFSPDCRVPLPDASVHTAYTSHTIEHLDSPTVERVLSEARRILRPGCRLVIKIPDFDRALECWRAGDASFFRDELWGLGAVTPTWASRGIEDSLSRRASMIFCGFWNRQYGDHFSGRINSHPHAYHGPAVVGEDELHSLIKDRTPAQISAYLRESVARNESGFKFNHQNAWSRDELAALLDRLGFEIVTTDKKIIAAGCADISDIRAMYEQSSYTVAIART